MTEPVLDASAILAMLQEEPGHEATSRELERGGCVISAMNLSEVAAKLVDGGMTREEVTEVLRDLDLQVHDFDEALALECAWLREPARTLGLSLGDRACLALARHLSRPALTADRNWTALSIGVKVKLVRS